ncbi:MAG TPA: hypothetical protein VK791_05375, partial [bacterium]|nr:hypothetical protein [bacterium]
IFLVILCFFLPRIGGVLLICNAINYAFLVFANIFYIPGLSVSSVVDNFISYGPKSNLFLNLLVISGTMTLLGCSFIVIELKEKSSKRRTEKLADYQVV